ncbi:MAG: DEAD/DEAH box helicase [Candidatus Bathyarchaeota archaeon]
MAQDNSGNMQQRAADRFRRFLRRAKVVEALLDFTINTDDHGRHVIEVFMTIDGERSKVQNIKGIWTYGFSFEKGNVRYVLSRDSLDTLLALKSMSPEIREDGTIISDVYPSVLNYLRKREGVHEDESSKRFVVMESPLKHRGAVSYDPSKGLRVKAGYEVPDCPDVVKLSELGKSADGEYVRFRDSFYHLPEEGSETRKWVEAEEKSIELEDVPEFFKRDLILLKSNFNAVLTEPAQNIRIVEQKFQPRFNLKTDGGGWLDFKVEYHAGEHIVPSASLKGCNSEHIHPDESTWIKVDRATVDRTNMELEALSAAKTRDGYRVEVARFQSVEEAIEHLGGTREASGDYERFLDELTGFKPDPEFKLPEENEKDLAAKGITLRPYQREGINWVDWLMRHHLHCILADDMGLGKTIQIIATMRAMYESTWSTAHSLVVCPKSVVGHWQREIRRAYPNIGIYTYVESSRERFEFARKRPTIFVTTYEILSRDIETLAEVPFFFAVLDEGTRIKNPDTKRTSSAKMLNSVHRIVLSGTPIENRPSELWSIFDFLIRGHLGSYDKFISRYEKPIQDGDKDAVKSLANRIKPFVLRRLKEDVAKDLPEKIEMNYWCGLTEEQKSLYGQIQDTYVSPIRESLQKSENVTYTSILPVITKLKQVCDHPALINGKFEPIIGRSEKFDLIIEIVEEILEKKEAAVLFTHFLGALNLFESYLKDKAITYMRIDGSTQNRQELIDRFNKGEASIALCSLTAASQGINLTAANHVIHVDRWWNPAVEDQATDRVHRIGQTKTVYVYKILTEGTLEEKIDDLLEKKKNLSSIVMNEAAKGSEGWTREEMLEILKQIKA